MTKWELRRAQSSPSYDSMTSLQHGGTQSEKKEQEITVWRNIKQSFEFLFRFKILGGTLITDMVIPFL